MTLPNGTSTRVHAEAMFANIDLRLAAIGARLRDGRRIGPADRETLSRRLAGIVGDCEALRVWLGAGAPE